MPNLSRAGERFRIGAGSSRDPPAPDHRFLKWQDEEKFSLPQWFECRI
jgi:hypothetical protein